MTGLPLQSGQRENNDEWQRIEAEMETTMRAEEKDGERCREIKWRRGT